MVRGTSKRTRRDGKEHPLNWQLETRDGLLAGDKAAVRCFGPQPVYVFVVGAFDVEHCGMQARVAGWWCHHNAVWYSSFRCVHRRNPQIRCLLHFRPGQGCRQSNDWPLGTWKRWITQQYADLRNRATESSIVARTKNRGPRGPRRKWHDGPICCCGYRPRDPVAGRLDGRPPGTP